MKSAFLLALLVSAVAFAQTNKNDQRARDIYKQLIEINITDSAGSTTAAAEAVSKRLIEAGYAPADVKALGPNARKGSLTT